MAASAFTWCDRERLARAGSAFTCSRAPLAIAPSEGRAALWRGSSLSSARSMTSHWHVHSEQVWDAEVSTLVVEGVRPGGAAARSGLVEVDDIVCEVDGINVTGQPLDVVESLMRGQAVGGSSLCLPSLAPQLQNVSPTTLPNSF